MPVEGAGVCARFDGASVRVGQIVTLVYVDSASARVTTRAEVARRRATPCPDPFARSDASGTMVAYDLLPREPLAASFDALDPALVVASAASWSRGPDGIPRADLDGDGVPDEAHRCLVDKGWRFTVWSGPVARGQRRWAAYWDLGAEVDATCTAEESA